MNNKLTTLAAVTLGLLITGCGSTTSSTTATTEKAVALEQGPFSGTPHVIPGKVEAEQYDWGGEGVGFRDQTTAGEGQDGIGNCKRGDNVYLGLVDAQVSQDECAVAWTEKGEWLNYTVDVKEASDAYTLTVAVSHGFEGSPRGTFKLQVEKDGEWVDLTDDTPVPFTDPNWTIYEELEIEDVVLEEGVQKLRLLMTGNGGPGVHTPGNFDWFMLEP